ncbi:KilA-N domain-containing protein [Chryseobacterium piscicola]|uniref:DNA-binding protein n=1 Tax=Chryseobacterium piscicola TaxID=551459 RepID=A0A1N7JY84_9FLAO|nr:KilA-N domain-containing protein [Chryseobacterium piscicola]PQA96600.1 DNA-binding protein [Chryseobacterium piscicola]SIS54290.1 KilA-N domain-containing protein [Chryseobacterium piscicola]
MPKNNLLKVQDIEISITCINDTDYICLTDMAKAKEDDSRAADIIKNWIRNRGTIEFLGTWESIYNPDFKVVEFDHFRKEAGLPTFTMSVNNWVEKTNAIGVFSKQGKYGGTYAHKDIAFEFGSAISPVFKLYIIREYQRLKEIESNKYGLEWDIKRVLSKANYQIHTDAIKNYIIPTLTYSQKKDWIYAEEADLLNIVLFGCTAKQWKQANPQKVLNGENIRDMASINDLTILSNIESLNSSLIKNKIDKKNRFKILLETVKDQRKSLESIDIIKSLKKISDTTFFDAQNKSVTDKDQKSN